MASLLALKAVEDVAARDAPSEVELVDAERLPPPRVEGGVVSKAGGELLEPCLAIRDEIRERAARKGGGGVLDGGRRPRPDEVPRAGPDRDSVLSEELEHLGDPCPPRLHARLVAAHLGQPRGDVHVQLRTAGKWLATHRRLALEEKVEIPELRALDRLSLIHISEPTRRTPISYA